ncbi:hypothetical protein PPERSA_11644 [Pseudocohnilembus persalinus]|uniref:Isy1-like splicing factor n=1 Tax=Pseudocohnilembus persalinus TaxID=266149 RepID=A0A0V0Q9Y8_PSEPJ|nr:hypothetical protein PPERSA_11644 [Pseudocohnilembus persalinus]|eukprot:KRW99043.1 hypothetical protein PPERSA_11644 [Pseudocohnilembus persalinus]
MARSEEKAQAMLNRWYQQKKDLGKKEIQRPKGFNWIQKIDSLNSCEKWRNSILREISKLVSQVQNAGLGEFRIREINDEINQLLKEKKMWEERIIELGGPDYRQVFNADLDGSELPGFGGYKYFGAAKDLPGVRELFQKEAPKAPQKNGLLQVYKKLNFPVYLGKEIENEEEILEAEAKVEEIEREQEFQKWVESHQKLIKKKLKPEEREDREKLQELIEWDAERSNDEDEQDEDQEDNLIDGQNNMEVEGSKKQKTAQDYMLEEKKKMLLEQFAKEAMQQD